jgi:citrate lyase subunit alpha/citrate CoA-transferase
MNKLVKSLEDAIRACGLRDSMTVDFHHHLRDGDRVVPMVMNAIGKMGIKDLKLCASGLFDGMVERGLGEQIRKGVVTSVEKNR